MTTTALRYLSRGRKVASLSFPRINWKLFYLFCLLLSLLMLVFYVYLVNQLTMGTLIIKNYNKEIDALVKENRALEINLAETGFLANASERAKELSFERTTNIKYVQILESSLAKAK